MKKTHRLFSFVLSAALLLSPLSVSVSAVEYGGFEPIPESTGTSGLHSTNYRSVDQGVQYGVQITYVEDLDTYEKYRIFRDVATNTFYSYKDAQVVGVMSYDLLRMARDESINGQKTRVYWLRDRETGKDSFKKGYTSLTGNFETGVVAVGSRENEYLYALARTDGTFLTGFDYYHLEYNKDLEVFIGYEKNGPLASFDAFGNRITSENMGERFRHDWESLQVVDSDPLMYDIKPVGCYRLDGTEVVPKQYNRILVRKESEKCKPYLECTDSNGMLTFYDVYGNRILGPVARLWFTDNPMDTIRVLDTMKSLGFMAGDDNYPAYEVYDNIVTDGKGNILYQTDDPLGLQAFSEDRILVGRIKLVGLDGKDKKVFFTNVKQGAVEVNFGGGGGYVVLPGGYIREEIDGHGNKLPYSASIYNTRLGKYLLSTAHVENGYGPCKAVDITTGKVYNSPYRFYHPGTVEDPCVREIPELPGYVVTLIIKSGEFSPDDIRQVVLDKNFQKALPMLEPDEHFVYDETLKCFKLWSDRGFRLLDHNLKEIFSYYLPQEALGEGASWNLLQRGDQFVLYISDYPFIREIWVLNSDLSVAAGPIETNFDTRYEMFALGKEDEQPIFADYSWMQGKWITPWNTPANWAQEEVGGAIDAGLVPEELQTYYPSRITRLEFCRMVTELIEEYTGKSMPALLAERKVVPIAGRFTDTNEPCVLAANALGIVNGRGGTIFDPDAKITRAEAAVLLANTAKVLGIQPSAAAPAFSDAGQFPSWAQTQITSISSIFSASGKAVMGGVGGGRFAPFDGYSREQAYITAYRLFTAK